MAIYALLTLSAIIYGAYKIVESYRITRPAQMMSDYLKYGKRHEGATLFWRR